jgi:tetratricopeptide (TPR) repeat protein
MIRLNKIQLLLLLFLVSIRLAGQDLYDYQNSKKFANYLYKSGQYSLAIDEFERVIFLHPEDFESKISLIKSYRLSGEFSSGLRRLKSLYGDGNTMPTAFIKEKFHLYIMLDSISRAKALLPDIVDNSLEKEAYQLGLILLEREWKEAATFSKSVQVEDGLNKKFYSILTNRLEQGRKSPFVAAALSTVVPGLGKVYTKRYADAIMAFLFVGGNAWQAYRGFSQYGVKSVYGWIFGGLATSFYIGNIYGAVKSAKRFNKERDDDAYQKAKYLFDTGI